MQCILQDQIRLLHQKVKAAETSAEKDALLRKKVTDDYDTLLQQNCTVEAECSALRNQLKRVRI